MEIRMRTNLSTRYSDDLLLLLSKAAFLDPRLKTLPFLSSTETEELYKYIQKSTLEGPPATKKAKGEHDY